MNLPNGLTLLRIFFVPVLIVILLTRSPNIDLFGYQANFEVWGVIVLLLAAATDWADGYFARRHRQVILLHVISVRLLLLAATITLKKMRQVLYWINVNINGMGITIIGLLINT